MKLWRILPVEKKLHTALMTTLILSATRQNFSHFRACCVNADFHSLHTASAEKIPLCSLEASFYLLFHQFLQLVLKLKMGQHFNTIPSKCLYMCIHLCQVGLKSTGLELVWNHRMAHTTINLPLELMSKHLLQKSCFEKNLCRSDSLRFCQHSSEIHLIWSLQK